MNQLFVSTISMGTICLVGFVVNNKVTRAPKFRELSESTKELLELMSHMENPALKEDSPVPKLPATDIIAIYIKSRGNRNFANHERVESDQPGCAILLKWIERDHKLIKRLMFASLGGKLVDKIAPGCHSVYARLLWTYGNQQEVLNQLSQYLPHADQQVISQRV